MTKFEALKAAIKKAGGQIALAKICGVTQSAVSKWENSIKELPLQYCRTVERALGIPAHQLQPSHFDPPSDLPNVSGEWRDEYGNRNPVLDKNLEGVAL